VFLPLNEEGNKEEVGASVLYMSGKELFQEEEL